MIGVPFDLTIIIWVDVFVGFVFIVPLVDCLFFVVLDFELVVYVCGVGYGLLFDGLLFMFVCFVYDWVCLFLGVWVVLFVYLCC